MGKVVKIKHNQSGYVKQELEKLMDTGKTDKTELYSIIETKTGLPRPTIRRIAGDLRKDLSRKINILEMSGKETKHDKNEKDPFSFVPKKIRWHWEKLTQHDLIPVKCTICNSKIGYLEGFCDGNLVCNICRDKFPEAKKRK